MIDIFNSSVAGLLAAVAGYAAVSPRVKCGLVAHVGLTLLSTGLLGNALITLQAYHGADAVSAAQAITHAGLVLIAIEYIRRVRHRGPQRRKGDWVDRHNP